ncbi:MAG: hypothetical protein EPO35_05030 [Acidobacteria bacterium]|nr:MAG: hypothetical protein EPO35_05030 [Acidobacteriota bacterium]
MTRRFVALAALALCLPSLAFAQKRKAPVKNVDHGEIYVNGAYQGSSGDVSSTVSFTANLETGSFTSKFRVMPGAAFDAGGRVRVWKRLGVGAAVTSFSANGTTDITGQVPHPFFFRTPRSITGEASIERKETAFHLRAVVSSPPGRRLQFSGFAGPVFFSVSQTLVDKANYSDAYPFDTATFTSATTRRVSKSKTGFGAGADVAYYFMKNLGVGFSASFASGSFDLRAVDDSPVAIKAGGGLAGLGLRIRF